MIVAGHSKFGNSRQASGASAPRAAREPRKNGENGNSSTSVITRTQTKPKRPSMYRVLLLNDDYTPMDPLQCIMEKK